MRITTLILFHTCRNLPLRACEPIVHSSSGNNRVTEALLLVPPAPKHTGHGIGFSLQVDALPSRDPGSDDSIFVQLIYDVCRDSH